MPILGGFGIVAEIREKMQVGRQEVVLIFVIEFFVKYNKNK